MENKMQCPYCGKTEFVKGIQMEGNGIMPIKKLTLKAQPIYHIVCLNCGTIIRSYIKKPDKLDSM